MRRARAGLAGPVTAGVIPTLCGQTAESAGYADTRLPCASALVERARMAAPEVFGIEDDKDVVALINPEPGEHLRSKVEDAILMCPVAAIRFAD